MKISKGYYDIWGKDFIYYIEAGSSSIVAYTISSIIDGVTTVLEQEILAASATATITFDVEGQYQITVYYPNNGGTASDTYDIRCYPNIKTDIIASLKDVICNCPNLGIDYSNCSNTPLTSVEQDVHLMQMTYNSVGLYTNLLMSPSFLRAYSCCFMGALGENYYKIETLIKNLFAVTTLNGYTPNSYYLMRVYTAYYYVMLYVMELDMASSEDEGSGTIGTGGNTGSDAPLAGDITADITIAVQTLFDVPSIKACFISLGLDFSEIYTSFNTCYMANNVGICETTSSAPLPAEYGAINNLTYTNYSFYVEIDTIVSPTLFGWDVEGTPVALVLDDGGYGEIVDVSVTGSSYSTAATYTFAVKGAVQWTLEGTNTSQIKLQCHWMLPAYYGTSLVETFPIEADILAGTKMVGGFSTEITVPLVTSAIQYGWIAVPVAEAVQYNNWQIQNASLNGSVIGTVVDSEQFIEYNPAGTITVDGNKYRVYMYTYPSEVTDSLKLFKETNTNVL